MKAQEREGALSNFQKKQASSFSLKDERNLPGGRGVVGVESLKSKGNPL